MPRRDEIEISARELEGAWVIDIAGEIDLYRSPAVRKKFVEILGKKPRRFLVNLKKVAYMDSSGLATLIEAFQTCKKLAIFFGLFGVNSTLRGLFEITRLEKVFHIYNEEAEAIEASVKT